MFFCGCTGNIMNFDILMYLLWTGGFGNLKPLSRISVRLLKRVRSVQLVSYSPPPYLGDFVRDGMALLTRYSVRWRILFPRRQNPHLGDFFRDGTANIYDIASPFRAAILYTPFFTTKKSFFFFTDGTLLFKFFSDVHSPTR